MNRDPLRPLRLQWDSRRDPGIDRNRLRAPGLDVQSPRGAPRFIGQVFNAGAIPVSTDRVFLVHPVRLDGPESEGAAATTAIDASRAIPVLVVGAIVPKVGDLLIAVSVGGRWIAVFGGSPSTTVACSPCVIPRKALTLSWTNTVLGNGSTVLTFNGTNEWRSGCANQLIHLLACRGGETVFSSSYFVAGSCPTGQTQSCTGPGESPHALAMSQQICSPFLMRYTVTAANCPTLAGQGYTSFTITE